MQKWKTQHGNAGHQGKFNFLYTPSSLTAFTKQGTLCGYRVDSQLNVLPNWRHNYA